MEVEGSDGVGAKILIEKPLMGLLQKSSPEMIGLDQRQNFWLGWICGGSEREI